MQQQPKQFYWMFDLFPNEQGKSSSLGTIDYRNAKYHGHTLSNEPEGLGIVLDHHYLLTISQWHQAVAFGPTFSLYPDGTTFRGAIEDELPKELCVFTNNKGISIYVDFSTNRDISIAIDSSDTHTLHFIKINEQIYCKLLQSTDENYLLEQYLRDQRQEKVVLLGQKSYSTYTTKMDMISQFFERNLEDISEYRSFIRSHFGNKQQQGLEIVESREDFSFHFKHTSITCKISHGNPLAIKNIGYFNSISREMQIQRKDLGTANLQQLIDSTIFQYPKMPAQRPFDCLNSLHQYYKKSLGFRNQYFCVDYIYRIKFIFHSIEQLFSDINIKTLAQQLLENPILVQHNNKAYEVRRQDFSNFAIQQVKEDVYRAARKKSAGKISQSTILNQSALRWHHPSAQEIRRHTINHSFSFKEKQPSVYQQIIGKKTLLKDQRKTQQKLHPSKSTSYNYLEKQYRDIGTASRVRRSPLSKYAYLEEESERVNQKRITNIKNLTAYYQWVERDVGYQMYNGSDQKSTKWQKSPSTELSESKLKLQTSSNGPKRMLKYGWD